MSYDLSDVDLNSPRFRAEFPDGKVPIKHLPTRFYRERYDNDGASHECDGREFVEYLWDLHHQLALLDAYDCDALVELAHEFDHWWGRVAGEGSAFPALRRRKLARIVSDVMTHGLSLRQTARFLGISNGDCVSALLSSCSARTPEMVERIMRADEIVLDCPWEKPTKIARDLGWQRDARIPRKLAEIRCNEVTS